MIPNESNHIWILYDGRAESLDTDDCTVYLTCESEEEGWENIDDGTFPDGILFKYDMVFREGEMPSAENERRVRRCSDCKDGAPPAKRTD